MRRGRGRCNPAKGQVGRNGLRPDWRGGPATASNGRRVGTWSPLQRLILTDRDREES